MRHNAERLLADASDCGLRITGLDGWTQTRLAKTLRIRRETLNAIINRSPGTEPTSERPKLVEACQKLITFAAALSAKDDAVLKNPIDAGNLLSDDGQAYEHHRLRLHRLVEAAVEGNQFTDALCRLGEFASAAMHAPKPYRLRMICNLVTAIQRLLDKPASRETPAAVLRANLARLYRAERAARRCGRDSASDKGVREQRDYVCGQVGYALVFSGMLLAEGRLVRRGGKRLFAAAAAQPDPSYGHWCNLMRATNDLLASGSAGARDWAARILTLAAADATGGFGKAYTTLGHKQEIAELRSLWEAGADRLTVSRLIGEPRGKIARRPVAARGLGAIGAVVAMALVCSAMLTASAFAGDGRDFQPVKVVPDNTPRATPADAAKNSAPRATTPATPTTPTRTAHAAADHPAVDKVRRRNDFNQGFRIEREPEAGDGGLLTDSTEDLSPTTIVQSADVSWGESLASYGKGAGAKAVVPTPAAQKPATPTAKPVALEPAEKAARVLSIAKNYVAVEKHEVARQKLQEILKAYPSTPAAEEAKVMLAALPSN